MQSISGVIVATATPFDENARPDIGLMGHHVARLLDDGCHFVAPFGTTGEANSVDADARIATLRALADAGIDPARLVPGTGAVALQDAIKITEAALALGVAGVMILPPFYYPDQGVAGFATYYRPLLARAAKADIPVLFYNIPQLSGVRIPLELMDLMRTEFGAVAHGVKDSSGDRAQTDAYLARSGDYAVFPGTENLLDVALAAGGAGCITGPGNLSAAFCRVAYDALQAGGAADAEPVLAMKAIRTAIQKTPLIPAIKYLLAKRYGQDIWRNFLPPLVPLSSEDCLRLEADLAETGVWTG